MRNLLQPQRKTLRARGRLALERGRLGRRLWCLERLFWNNQWSPHPRP